MAQSLPSFAQAFNTPYPNSISSTSNALPPIHFRSDPPRTQSASIDSFANNRKRSRPLPQPTRDVDLPDTDRLSPRLIQIKEEHDFPMLVPPNSTSIMLVDSPDSLRAPPPSALLPTPSKKRRVTISGTPHPLNTDVHIPPAADQANSTPISPVVIGLSIQRDDPAALEQVRSMLSVKQKQKALIEQRRGSVAGILSTSNNNNNSSSTAGTGTGTSGAAPTPGLDAISDERLPTTVKAPHIARPLRRSPNASNSMVSATVSRRSQHQQQQSIHPAGTAGPPSPGPMMVPSQQQQSIQLNPPPAPTGIPKGNPLPPPISFARRRAGQFGTGKKKPADIVISPRESHTREQLQPAIQSAPPVLHAGQEGQQQQFLSHFPMALPRVPSIGMSVEGHYTHGSHGTRRPIAGQVPPTPSRFSLQRNNNNTSSTSSSSSHPLTSNFTSQQAAISPNSFGARSPPASVAIATTLVPPTPTSLHHSGYTGDKSAFLAPFGLFYDALNDSKQLKNWLGEQLHRSNTLLQSLTSQQEKLDELVESLVNKKMIGVKEEIGVLHRRVEELEDALRVARSEMITRRQSVEVVQGPALTTSPISIGRASGKQQQPVRNGIGVGAAMTGATDMYTFPPVQPMRKASSPPPPGTAGWKPERERENQASLPGSENGSPAPFGSRRLSISAMRLDPPRMQQQQQQQQQVVEPPSSSSSSQSFGLQSPPALSQMSLSQQQQQAFRDGPLRHGHGHGHAHGQHPHSGKSGVLSVNSTPSMSYRSGGHATAMGDHRPGSPMDDD